MLCLELVWYRKYCKISIFFYTLNAAFQELVFFFFFCIFFYCACCLSDMYIFRLFPTFFVLCAEVLNDSFIYVVVEWAIQFLLKNVNENV